MDLIIIAGMPATGKTTLSKKIAAAFGMPILEKDEIKKEADRLVKTIDKKYNAVVDVDRKMV